MPTYKELQAAIKARPRDELFFVIDQFIHSERDRALLKRRLHDDVTIEYLSEEFGISPRQCADLLKRGQGVIYLHIT